MKKHITLFNIIPLVCFLFYFLNIKTGFKPFDLAPHLNYFRYLADAFLHGRLYLTNPPSAEDLILFHNKLYLYWPPVPALIFTPLVALFGMDLPDTFINSLFGITNVWLVMKICHSLDKKFSLGLTMKNTVWVGLFWGLGTVHFYMSKEGSVWFISQIMAQTFLLTSTFILLSKKDNIGSLLLSGLFFAMAVYTRNHLVFSIFFLMCLYLAMNLEMSFKKLLAKGSIFIIPFFVLSILNGYYNYMRFENVLENGIRYHNMAIYFSDNFQQYGYFSWYYFKHNFFIEVLHFPSLSSHFPFIQVEWEGFGFIWGSPAFLLLIPATFLFIKKIVNNDRMDKRVLLMQTGCTVSTILIALIIFMIMGTGWVQFCARYTLDFYLFIILIILFSWKDLLTIPYIRPMTVCLILISIFIQFIGAWQFSKL